MEMLGVVVVCCVMCCSCMMCCLLIFRLFVHSFVCFVRWRFIFLWLKDMELVLQHVHAEMHGKKILFEFKARYLNSKRQFMWLGALDLNLWGGQQQSCLMKKQCLLKYFDVY